MGKNTAKDYKFGEYYKRMCVEEETRKEGVEKKERRQGNRKGNRKQRKKRGEVGEKEVKRGIRWRAKRGSSSNFRYLQFSTFFNENLQMRFVPLGGGEVFHLSHREHTIDDVSEYNMFIIQPIALVTCNEELTAVCVLSTVGTGEKSRAVMTKNKVFIFILLLIVDTKSSRSVAVQKVSSLDHKVLDDTMER